MYTKFACTCTVSIIPSPLKIWIITLRIPCIDVHVVHKCCIYISKWYTCMHSKEAIHYTHGTYMYILTYKITCTYITCYVHHWHNMYWMYCYMYTTEAQKSWLCGWNGDFPQFQSVHDSNLIIMCDFYNYNKTRQCTCTYTYAPLIMFYC